MSAEKSLKEVAALFLRLGFTAFGGPAVHIAMMEKEVVEKKQWITPSHFLDLLGATNLIPGPNSTEMAMHCGHERAGWKGLLVAGLCFILPAVVITGIISYLYQEFGTLPEVRPFIYGIKPAIISVIVVLMINLGKKAIKNLPLLALAILCSLAVFLGVSEIVVLFSAGIIGMIAYTLYQRQANAIFPFGFMLFTQVQPISNFKTFLIFLKIGSILYGSGYVLFAFLEDELVTNGWISKQQLIDAIAIGQFTPGPVFSSATFIGWQIGGIGGAIAATIGIFLPSFLFVAFLNPIIPMLRKSKLMSAFLDSVNVASIALILIIIIQIGKESITNWPSVIILIAGFFLTFIFKNLNTAWIILGGAFLGYLLHLIFIK